MMSFKYKGDWRDTFSFFGRTLDTEYIAILESYARAGVAALAAHTPVDSGSTAASWDYQIKTNRRGTSIYWLNRNQGGKVSVAILLQYGHATGTGGYVQGQDFINPAIKPVFEKIADEVWKEVTRK